MNDATAQHDPLILEDVLLLHYRPDAGTITGEGVLFYVLGGATLIDLAMQDLIVVGEAGPLGGRTVSAAGEAPPRDPLLIPAWETIREKPRKASTFVASLGTDLRGPVLDRLEERGWVIQEERKLLGLIPNDRLVPGDLSRRTDLVGQIRRVLEDGVEPDARTAALTALLSASGALPVMHREIPWNGTTAKRAFEIQEGSWGASATGAAVARTTAAIAASAAVASVVATSTAVSS